MNRATPDGIKLVEQGLVTAIEEASGVRVGVNRESASAGSAVWTLFVPEKFFLYRAPENHNPRMKTTSPPITSFSGKCPVTAFP